MMVLKDLYPERVFYYFEEICGIPHGSRNTKAISDYLAAFARTHGLTYYQDESNNIIIIKPATEGYENAEPVIIQGHMDMVCEKENGCNIDFEKDGLTLYVEDGYVKAKGTTLGGDDGIAVAYALALLESKEFAHPRLEVVITVDEEIGMLGACEIDLSVLTGHTMLNIDSDVEGHFLTSCAGGLSLNATIPVQRITQNGRRLSITVTGLTGGHSGSEIHKEHGNADILMGRILNCIWEQTPFGMITLAGGLKDNAIPRECRCDILVPDENVNFVKKMVNNLDATLKKELQTADAGVCVLCEDGGNAEAKILDFASINKVIYYLRTVPNAVIHMSQVMPDLVETSLNLGIMELKEDHLFTVTSIRSSVSSRKEDLKNRVTAIVEMCGGEVEVEGDYPAWEYKTESPLRKRIAQVYEALYGKEPVFDAIHAGLECGLFSDKIKDLDCVSFGPENLDIHTPKERLNIASVGRVWDFLLEFLKQVNA